MKMPFTVLMFSAGLCLGAGGGRGRYSNFAALAADKQEGVDFDVEAVDRGSHIGVIAVHGGIEIHTQEIARAIAEDDLNLYVFESLKKKGKWSLHVTSTHFDDPRAVEIMNNSQIAISIHGYVATEAERICIG